MAIATGTAIALGVAATAGAAGTIIASGEESEQAEASAEQREREIQRQQEISTSEFNLARKQSFQNLAAQRQARQEAIAGVEELEAPEAAEATPFELNALQRQLAVAERGIARQERLLSAIDPSVMEASKQALQLLRGQEAQTLEPIRRERSRQRVALQNRLREQLGTGFETSTGGSEALNRFDEQTTNVLSGAQQQALQVVGGLVPSLASARPSPFGGVTALETARAGRTQVQQRLFGAQTQIQQARVAGIFAPAAQQQIIRQQIPGQAPPSQQPGPGAAAGIFGGLGQLAGIVGGGLFQRDVLRGGTSGGGAT